MHRPIKENLEEYLKGFGDRGFDGRDVPPEFAAHLASCESCAGEVAALGAQAALLRSLRPPAALEPRPAFYARVMDRIERQTVSSIWTTFLEPAFGRRLAVASAALVLLLGTYLVTTEPGERPANALTQAQYGAAYDAGGLALDKSARNGMALTRHDTPQQERDAVLVNLATYHDE